MIEFTHFWMTHSIYDVATEGGKPKAHSSQYTRYDLLVRILKSHYGFKPSKTLINANFSPSNTPLSLSFILGITSKDMKDNVIKGA